MKLIGLSLMHCIKDIINGKVNCDDVDYIITQTMPDNDLEWEQLISGYRDYWDPDPDGADNIATWFWRMRKLKFPRKAGLTYSISKGHWIVPKGLKKEFEDLGVECVSVNDCETCQMSKDRLFYSYCGIRFVRGNCEACSDIECNLRIDDEK